MATATATRTLHERFQIALEAAYLAGVEAGERAIPRPMVVGTPKDMASSLMGGDGGGFDPEKPTYFISEGACGFAWINLRAKGTDGRKFLNWIQEKVKSDYPAGPALDQYDERTWRETSVVNPPRKDSYYGGVSVWVGGFGQSIARKEAFAREFARVINESAIEGLTAYAGSRLD